MNASSAWLTAALRSGALRPKHSDRGHLLGDAGEGVISAAIAVLIMAFLGAAMWMGFRQMWTNVSTKTNTQMNCVGAATGTAGC